MASGTPRFILIARHGERLDRATEDLIKRQNKLLTPAQWKAKSIRPQDPPLSKLGKTQAFALGKAIASRGLRVNKIFSSPFIRCVQTSNFAADGCGIPDEEPVIHIEEGLCEECCSFRYPAMPIFLRRFDLCALSSRVNLEYASSTQVTFEDMACSRDGRHTEEHFKPVRDLILMGKGDNMPLNDPERHYVREVCDTLPNPFLTTVPEKEYRQCCEKLSLGGPVAGHPGWEITVLRLRTTLQRLGLLAGPVEPVVQHDETDCVLLVTHGACSTILFELLVGHAPAKMASVGSVVVLEKTTKRGVWAVVEEASQNAHLTEAGNSEP